MLLDCGQPSFWPWAGRGGGGYLASGELGENVESWELCEDVASGELGGELLIPVARWSHLPLHLTLKR